MRGDFFQVDGLQIHHVSGGQGSPPVLFVHGLGSAGYLEWRYTLPALARTHRVFAPDLPGFGRSDKPREGYGIPLFAHVVEEYMRTRRLRPVLVGASMGGRVALEVALRQPQSVRKLVLVNALGVVRPRVRPHYPLILLPRVGEGLMWLMREALDRLPPERLRAAARRYMGVAGDVDRVLNEHYLADLREMHGAEGYPEAYAATVRSLASPAEYRASDQLMGRLAATGLPVLLIWGAHERLFPLAQARLVQERLPGSRLAVIEDAAHSPQAENPEEFNRVLEDFLAS
jgi:pimeloyl-ACP methyl ester carboxylesterase